MIVAIWALDRVAVTSSYFVTGPEGFTPESIARGPWSPDMLHGRLLGGLAARTLEVEIGEPGWRAARLTVDLFRPAPMAPIQIETTLIRSGRRIRVADALLRCEGHQVGRATAVMLVVGEEPPGKIWRPDVHSWPDPETLPSDPEREGQDEDWFIRTVSGGFGTGDWSRLWTSETVCLVDGEPLSPFVRAALSGDLACPLANSSDQGLRYINADYTLAIGRYPVGSWIGLEVAQQIADDGISMATSTLVDLDGPFATSTGVSLATQPLAVEA